MIEGISAEALLADRGYDTNEIIAHAVAAGMEVVILPRRTERRRGLTMSISIGFVIWSKMLS